MEDQKPPEQEKIHISEANVYEALRQCYDPEIPINVVDMGLVYDVKIIDDWVGIEMTLTTPGCGMGGYIANIIREKLLEVPGVHDADVRVVWEPRWSPAMMSEDARKKLGFG